MSTGPRGSRDVEAGRVANSMARSGPIPILMYHNISALPPGARAARGLHVSPRNFARQMGLLRMLGYRGLSMSAAATYLHGEVRDRVAVITLDDGFVDNLEHALPVLLRHGFSATCYAVSGCVGTYNRWDAAWVGVRKPLMSMAQLRAWRDAGMEVGAHSRTHPRLTRCDEKSLRSEVHGSKLELETGLGAPVTQFCYPYGDHDDRVVAAVRDAGFSAATTTIRGRAGPDDDAWRLPRIAIARHHVRLQVAAKLLTGYEDRRR